MPHEFKVRFKIQNLELEIEGSREDIPVITQAVGQQFAGMLNPANVIVEGELIEENQGQQPPPQPQPENKSKRPTRSRSGRASSRSTTDGAPNIVWTHDPDTWGTPKKKWNTATKSLWLLYVMTKDGTANELTAGQIANIFNQHFKQSGEIRPNNVARDLGKLKLEQPSPIKEDANSTPSRWSLAEPGLVRGSDLVEQAQGKSTSSA